MAALRPPQMLSQVDDDTGSSLMESMENVQATMALLHSSAGVLINSMAEILTYMTEMKAALPPTIPSPTKTEEEESQHLPPPPATPPAKQPIAVDSSVDEKPSPYIHLKKIQIEMPVFNGLEVNHWILKAERYLDLGNFTESEKLRLAYLSLDGGALIWFNLRELYHEPFLDWNDFKSQVIHRFGGLDSRSAMERLLTLKQEGSVEEYLTRFEELVSIVSSSDSSPEMFFETIFVNGLRDEIRSMVTLFEPKGMNNIIRMARRLEKSPFCKLLNPPGEDDDGAIK